MKKSDITEMLNSVKHGDSPIARIESVLYALFEHMEPSAKRVEPVVAKEHLVIPPAQTVQPKPIKKTYFKRKKKGDR